MSKTQRMSLILVVCLLFISSCSAFRIRHTNEKGETRTYITDTVFTGTGTVLDCLVSPFHWVMGLFYLQPYVKGESIKYPTFGASGCFMQAYGEGGLSGLLPVPWPLAADPGPPRVRFVDINGHEMEVTGGAIEVMRVERRINFSMK